MYFPCKPSLPKITCRWMTPGEHSVMQCVGSRHKQSVEISLPWWNSHKDTLSYRLYLEIESTIFLLENYGLCFSRLCGLVWFGSLWNGNIHTSLIEGWRYRINYKDVFSKRESHLTRSVHAILGGQGPFYHHFYKFMLMKIICRQLGKMGTAHSLPHCSPSSPSLCLLPYHQPCGRPGLVSVFSWLQMIRIECFLSHTLSTIACVLCLCRSGTGTEDACTLWSVILQRRTLQLQSKLPFAYYKVYFWFPVSLSKLLKNSKTVLISQ